MDKGRAQGRLVNNVNDRLTAARNEARIERDPEEEAPLEPARMIFASPDPDAVREDAKNEGCNI